MGGNGQRFRTRRWNPPFWHKRARLQAQLREGTAEIPGLWAPTLTGLRQCAMLPTCGRLLLTVGRETAVGTTGPFDVPLLLKFLKQAPRRLHNLLPVNLSDLLVKLSFFYKLLV